MKIIIAGSRVFDGEDCYELFCSKMNKMIGHLKNVHLIHGGASGADSMATTWSRIGDSYTTYLPDYEKYKKNPKFAPLARNQEMVDSGATHLIAFWDGASKGTKDIIERARKKGLKIRIVRFDKEMKSGGTIPQAQTKNIQRGRRARSVSKNTKKVPRE